MGNKRGIDQPTVSYSTSPVPAHRTMHWLSIGFILIGVSLSNPAFVLGSIIGKSLGFLHSLIAILVGSLILTVVCIFTAVIGSRTRLSTYMITKFTFGTKGAFIVTLAIVFTLFGWFGVNAGIFGVAAQTIISLLTGITLNLPVLIIVGGGLMLLTAAAGYKHLDKIGFFMTILLLILVFVAIFEISGGQNLSDVTANKGTGDLPIGLAISIVAGAFMVGAAVIPDLTRYARNHSHAVGSIIIGILIGFPIIIGLTAILSIMGGDDFIRIMQIAGWTLPSMIVLVFASWTMNDVNLYSASLGLKSLFKRTGKSKLMIISGVAGIIFALAGILDQFVSWLVLLTILIPPIAGIYIADYFIVNQKIYSLQNLHKIPNLKVLPLIIWAVAALFTYATTPSSASGLGLFTFTTIPALDSLVISFLLHSIIGKITST